MYTRLINNCVRFEDNINSFCNFLYLHYIIYTPDLEFFTGARRHGSNTPVLQETLENVLTATIVLTSTLVVPEVTSVTYATIKIN